MSIECVMNRRSVREYTEAAVSDEQVKALLTAGMYAPSARNSQPWEFVVVRDREKLKKLSAGAPFWKMLEKAPLAIVVTANLEDYKSSTPGFFIQDCSACTQNILVAAEGSGLGGVWLGLYGVQERMDYVRETLNIPEAIQPFSLISLGVPARHPRPHTSFYQEKVHYESY